MTDNGAVETASSKDYYELDLHSCFLLSWGHEGCL